MPARVREPVEELPERARHDRAVQRSLQRREAWRITLVLHDGDAAVQVNLHVAHTLDVRERVAGAVRTEAADEAVHAKVVELSPRSMVRTSGAVQSRRGRMCSALHFMEASYQPLGPLELRGLLAGARGRC